MTNQSDVSHQFGLRYVRQLLTANRDTAVIAPVSAHQQSGDAELLCIFEL